MSTTDEYKRFKKHLKDRAGTLEGVLVLHRELLRAAQEAQDEDTILRELHSINTKSGELEVLSDARQLAKAHKMMHFSHVVVGLEQRYLQIERDLVTHDRRLAEAFEASRWDGDKGRYDRAANARNIVYGQFQAIMFLLPTARRIESDEADY